MVGHDTIPRSPCFQAMVPMRDGVRLNTFVYLPEGGGPRFPVILQRTPYGITLPECTDYTDCRRGWLPSDGQPLWGSILRGWKQIVAHGYAAIYQDTRGRYASEGEDRVYADDAADGHDTLEWIAEQDWTNHRVGLSGSSAGATTALAAASGRHGSLRALFVQIGGSSIYDDVVCEGNSIEMERLWLWVSRNIPGLSASHRRIVTQRAGLTAEEMAAAATAANARYERLEAARDTDPPFVGSDDWMHLPLRGYPDFSTWQPYLDEIISHPAPDEFRARHNFRRSIEIPGIHVTTWFDIFQTSVLAAFNDIQARVGNQQLWIGPNGHYFVYEQNFWPHDPYFEWFDHWLKGDSSDIARRPPVYYSPRAWVDEPRDYVADDWRYAERWPPPGTLPRRLYLCADGSLKPAAESGAPRSYRYDPRHPLPSRGGRNMSIGIGPYDLRPQREFADYGLTYRGATLDSDLTVAGEVRVTLNVQSDCPDTDFIAILAERWPDGRCMALMEGVTRAMFRGPGSAAQRLEPGRSVLLNISLAHIHHTFRAGNCIELDITSSNFPRRARNTNSGNALLGDDGDGDIRVATNTIHHSESRPSFVILPVSEP